MKTEVVLSCNPRCEDCQWLEAGQVPDINSSYTAEYGIHIDPLFHWLASSYKTFNLGSPHDYYTP